MIKFFRRIRLRLLTQASSDEVRQKLLMDSKFSKYLLYAIGEIILVVIGILIALQINNWNEGRKEAAFEVQILKSFKESLATDLADVDDNINTHTRALHSLDSILVLLESLEPVSNDSVSELFAAAMMPTRFVHSTSAFESLKAKGVNIISNSALQKKIVDVYDSQYGLFLLQENDFVDQVLLGYRTVMPTRFEESFRYDLSSSELTGHLKPLDFERLKTDQEFLYYIKTMRNWTIINIEFHYAKLRGNIVDLQEMIDNDIEQQEGS